MRLWVGTITGLKALLVLFDLGLCALLLVLLRRLQQPAWYAVLYAWNPLPVLEIAGAGHVDGAGLTLLLGACCLLLPGAATDSSAQRRRGPFLLAGALLAGAGLVKLFPLVLAPILFLLVPAARRRHFLVGFLGGLAAFLLPFLPSLTNLATTLDAYARNWEFAGFAFTALRRLTGSGSVARLILSAAFLTVVAAVTSRLGRRLRENPPPAARARLALNACYSLALALLLLTPTLQPWYALTLAAFLPFAAGPAGLLLCWAVFLTYQVQIAYFLQGQWSENPYVTAAVFLAPVAAAILSRFAQRGGRTAPA